VLNRLPVLAESRWLRFGAFSAYYALQGLPMGLTWVAFPAWLTGQGISKELVATFAATTALPWVLKVISGPFMDRFTFLPMGLRRPWILGAQILLLTTSCMLFFVSDLESHFWRLLWISTAMNAFAAMGDVAVDGLAVLIIPEGERGRANAFMGSSLVIGMSLAAGVSIPLLNAGGVPALGLFVVALVGLIAGLSLLVRERTGDRILPWTEGGGNPSVIRPVASFALLLKVFFETLVAPTNVLVVCIIFLHRATFGIYKVWAPAMGINRLGYSDADFVHWDAIALLVSAAIGLAVGPLIDKIGVRKAYSRFLLGAGFVYFVLFLTSEFLSRPKVAIGVLFLLETVETVTWIAFIAIAMSLSRLKLSSTHFASFMAFGNLGMSAGSAIYPALSDLVGIVGIFLAMAALYISAALLLTRFSLDRHRSRMAQLDSVSA